MSNIKKDQEKQMNSVIELKVKPKLPKNFNPIGPLKDYREGAKVRLKGGERKRLCEIVLEFIDKKFDDKNIWRWDGGFIITLEEITCKMYNDYPLDANYSAIWRWLWQTFPDHDWPNVQSERPEKLGYMEAHTYTRHFRNTYYGKNKRPRTSQEIISTFRHSSDKAGWGILICNPDHPLPNEKIQDAIRTSLKTLENAQKKLDQKHYKKLVPDDDKKKVDDKS